MHEAVMRRYRRVRDEEKPLPDLIMIDGGKAQLNAAADGDARTWISKPCR